MNPTTSAARPRVTGAAAALDRFLIQNGVDRQRPPLRYLRRKPGRGLVAVFGPDDVGEIYTVTVDELALMGEDVLDVPGRGATVRRFPSDPKLPALSAVMAPDAGGPVFEALESAVRRLHGVTPDWELRSVDGEPVRYKPGDRCVIRYRLRFARPGGDVAAATETRTHTVVAKLYRDPGEAEAADDLLIRLREQARVVWTARPLGVVGGLPLALTEDLGSRLDDPPAVSGLHVIHPGDATAVDVLRAAARALAELHTADLDTRTLTPRTAVDEAGKAVKRAQTLERHVPVLAPVARRVAEAISGALADLPDDGLRPGHGSYKPSQLLVRGTSVFLVDFDQFCLADPALDVGYFLAYLRPAGLWYRRAGRRAWFEEAAASFTSAYTGRLAERGVAPSMGGRIVSRSHVFEAALLLKIAARRANRLHSPRPGEVAAVLGDVYASLDLARRLGVPLTG